MFSRKFVLSVCGVAAMTMIMAGSVDAFVNARRTNHLTFRVPVALPGVTLAAGTYTFEVDGRTDVVRVLSRDGSQIYFLGFTTQIQRPAGLPSDRPVTFGEARVGTPWPITAWYPIGESRGHQFTHR